jgi:hypothetical protein
MRKGTRKTEATAGKRARPTATPARTARPTTRPKPPAGGGATHEQIALRAYAIHLSGTGGDAVEHWLRAERELLGG